MDGKGQRSRPWIDPVTGDPTTPESPRGHDGIHASLDPELPIETADVVVDGLFGHSELRCDASSGRAGGEAVEHLLLAARQLSAVAVADELLRAPKLPFDGQPGVAGDPGDLLVREARGVEKEDAALALGQLGDREQGHPRITVGDVLRRYPTEFR